MIFVDTDVLVDVLRTVPSAVHWMSTHGDVIATSGYSGFELFDGARNRAEVKDVQNFLSRIRIYWLVPTDCEAALREFEQVHLANAIGPIDMLIAHTAKSLGMPLHTFNLKHFAAVPGLQTIQPYTR